MRIVNEFEQIPLNVAPKLKKSDVVLTTYKTTVIIFFFLILSKRICAESFPNLAWLISSTD